MTKVYIFGNKTFYGIMPTDYAERFEFMYNDFPHDKLTNLESLPDYPIIVIDYDAFYYSGTVYQNYQDLLSKHLVRALAKGAYVVFVHYNERCPAQVSSVYEHGTHDMKAAEYKNLNKEQIGFKFMNEAGASLRPIKASVPRNHSHTKLHYFDRYLDTWGSSHMAFSNYGDENLIPIQITPDGDLLSFAKKYQKGKLIYLSCQRNRDDEKNTKDLIISLVKSVDSYKAHSYTEIPSWADKPLFDNEKKYIDENKDLNNQIETNNKLLQPFKSAKQLAFLSDNDFKNGLVEFLEDQFEMKITSTERFKEDFLIHGDKEEVLGVCEAKAINGGITKGAVYQLYNNREEQGYDDKTLGLVFVNSHLTGMSWKKRDKNIDAKAYEAAANENILIVRLLDLLRLWNMVASSKLSKDTSIKYLLNSKGWLKVDENENISILPQS